MKKQFDLYEYLEEQRKLDYGQAPWGENQEEDYKQFFHLCQEVHDELNNQYKSSSQDLDLIRIQRGAIMGHQKEMDFYKEKIRKIILTKEKVHIKAPPWYRSLEDGIFAELFGFCGLTTWIYDEKEDYKESTSAKIIGENIYFLINGRCLLQPQKIKSDRLEQLKRALLLGYPKERLETGVHEVYLKNGIRVTIFSGDLIKARQDVMVFRKYVLKSLSFEKLASLGTIADNAIPFFTTMVKAGFNILFSGQVRSGKTTFLQTWQSYENKELEGVSIATDTETDWKKIMGDGPFMELVADGENMENVIKPLLRGDNDYVILEEMRDATAFNFAIDITSIGTRRTKATIHSSRPEDIPYKMASKIHHKYGGGLEDIIFQIHKNFHFIFHMGTVEREPGKKVLESITELCYNPRTRETFFNTICKYDHREGKWKWSVKLERLLLEKDLVSEEAAKGLESQLAKLHRDNPL